MISNVPLLGYIENTNIASDECTTTGFHLFDGTQGVATDAVSEINGNGLDGADNKGTHGIDEVQEEMTVQVPPLRLSFGSAPLLGYIENSSTLDDDTEAASNNTITSVSLSSEVESLAQSSFVTSTYGMALF